MKLLILGSTGRVGRLLTQQALEAGHEVTAFLRDPAKLQLKHARLTVYVGDARRPEQIKAAMLGQNAVLSALGHNSTKTGQVLTEATKAVLAGLTDNQRFISLTGDGVGDPNDPPAKLGGRLVNLAVKLIPGGVFADGKAHADLLQASSANWILVRSPRMTSGERTDYSAGYLPVGFGTHANRADVAAFMLAGLSDNTWLRQAPIITSR